MSDEEFLATMDKPTDRQTRIQTLSTLIDLAYPDANGFGGTYQNGVEPGPTKLAQFKECLKLQKTPPLYSQDGKGDDAIAYVKLFDPVGGAKWFITEYSPVAPDGAKELGFGLCYISEAELGYIPVDELATVRGKFGLGIELDMHWKPKTIRECRKEICH